MSVTLNHLLTSHPFIVLDGALATVLEERGCHIADSLWSANVLLQDPNKIRALHFDYFRAGAQIAITASYQASVTGLMQHGFTVDAALALIKKSVTLAIEAKQAYQTEAPEVELLVAGSVGPYGAWLADGSEYRGDYQCTEQQFHEFHRPRIQALLEAGADLLACETLPSGPEINALATLLAEFPTAKAWFCFTLRDSQHLSDGTCLKEVLQQLNSVSAIHAVGINCIRPENVHAALVYLRQHTDLPLIVYPNSGEVWNAKNKTWHDNDGAHVDSLVDYLPQWLAAGAKIIGGCCRTNPEDIAALTLAREKLETTAND